jgi:mRNA-degrading endonuclease toxin of MazEF toxin-antitoxin module
MAHFRQGQIVLVPHAPFSDQIGTKARPALIISGDGFNAAHADVICVAISSRIDKDDAYRVDVARDSSVEFTKTGLQVTSSIKCWAIFAYQADLIQRELGQLPSRLLKETLAVLSGILGI